MSRNRLAALIAGSALAVSVSLGPALASGGFGGHSSGHGGGHSGGHDGGHHGGFGHHAGGVGHLGGHHGSQAVQAGHGLVGHGGAFGHAGHHGFASPIGHHGSFTLAFGLGHHHHYYPDYYGAYGYPYAYPYSAYAYAPSPASYAVPYGYSPYAGSGYAPGHEDPGVSPTETATVAGEDATVDPESRPVDSSATSRVFLLMSDENAPWVAGPERR